MSCPLAFFRLSLGEQKVVCPERSSEFGWFVFLSLISQFSNEWKFGREWAFAPLSYKSKGGMLRKNLRLARKIRASFQS